MQVASLEDGRIDENMLALSIGLATTGVYGLARAVNSEQWYRNIILHDSLYSCEQLLEFVYPELAKQNSWKLPVWYYISKSNMKSELAEEKAPHLYTEIVTESASVTFLYLDKSTFLSTLTGNVMPSILLPSAFV